MEGQAAARARRLSFKRDLREAYTDEEACPPEWAELLAQVERERDEIRRYVESECAAFRDEADITVALARRDRAVENCRQRVEAFNTRVKRLNLIAPLGRFNRTQLDAGEVAQPMFRVARG